MAADTIINFDDVPPGKEVIDHYKGITFINSPYFGSGYDYGFPFVERLGRGQANSGNQVLVIRNCSGDFCQSLVVGKFNYTRHGIQVFVGETLGPSVTTKVTLYAFDADRNVIASTSKAVKGGTGVHTLLQVSRPKGDIDTFEVRGQGFLSRLAIDDLRFDNSDKIPSPDFGISRIGPLGDGIRQGFSATATIRVNRVNGSSGNILFKATGLPYGVSASFSPNPSSSNEILMSFKAASDARLGLASVTVTATPQVASAGHDSRALTIPLIVAANFAIESKTIDIPQCTVTRAVIKIYTPNTLGGPEPGLIPVQFSGYVDIYVSSILLGVDVKFGFYEDYARVYLEGGRDKTFIIRIAPLPGSIYEGKDLKLELEAKSPPYPSVRARLSLHGTAGSLEGFRPNSGSTPHALQPGTEITLSGTGFCPLSRNPIEVEFGNVNAKAKVTWVDDRWGRTASVRVPRLATDGPLTVKTVHGSFTLKEVFAVRTHRNTHGFAFENYDINYFSYEDLSEAFGKEQTYISITLDPCEPFFFLPSCPVLTLSLIPNPIGLIVREVALKSIDASCYGMAVTSERLLKGEISYGSFMPGGATTVRQLCAADGPWEPLKHHIFIQNLSQISAEIYKHWLSQADVVFTLKDSSDYRDRARNMITDDLRDGNYPFIMIREGGKGHVVVAYDLEESNESNIAYYIYTYDPNYPFAEGMSIDGVPVNENLVAGSRGEDEKRSQYTHLGREETLSRITVYNTGRYDPPRTLGWSSNIEMRSNFVVTPYEVVPRRPTFPASIEGMLIFAFGSVTITQISDANDCMLFGPDGSINTDPITHLRSAVAPWVPLNGIQQSALSDAYIIEDNKYHRWTLKGKDKGKYSNFIIAKDFGVKLDDLPVNPTSTDEISVDPIQATFGFHTDESSKPLSVSLVAGGASDRSTRTVILKTTSNSSGHDVLAFDTSRETFSYTHEGEPTTFTITLGWAGNMGRPTVFRSEPLSIGPGEIATFHPTNWPSLDQSPVELILTGQNDTASQRLLYSAQETVPFTIDDISVHDTNGAEKVLRIDTTWTVSNETSDSKAIVWLVTKDNTLIGENHIALQERSQNTSRSRTDTWTFLAPGLGQYHFTAYVMAITGQLPPNSHVLYKTIPFTVGNINQQSSGSE